MTWHDDFCETCGRFKSVVSWAQGDTCFECLEIAMIRKTEEFEATQNWWYRVRKWYFYKVYLPVYYRLHIRLPY